MSSHQPLSTYEVTKSSVEKRLEVQDFTVTFYTASVKPDGLPNFPYAVTGSAAGQVKMMAYVAAHDPSDARYALEGFFPGAYVESVEPGRQEVVVSPDIHGMKVSERRAGLLTRMYRALV